VHCGKVLTLLVFGAFAPVLAGASGWTRIVRTNKGDRVDSPAPHSLAYFTAYPYLRDEAGDLCHLCTPEKRLAEARKSKYKARASVSRVGILQGFAIYDVRYFFDDAEEPDWKSILVKIAPNQYREIYHLQLSQIGAKIHASVLVKAGSDTILATVTDVGGNKGMTAEDYFWFDRLGANLIDLDPIKKAAKAVVPPGKRIYNAAWGGIGAFTALTFDIGVADDTSGLCCSGGVEIKIALDHGTLIVKSARYVPGAA
jgi:hypothetical protein